MKKLAILAALLFSCPVVYAYDVWQSSNTATADTTKSLCSNKASLFTRAHGVVHGVCVNTGTAGTFTLYNSSATTANPVAAIDTTAKGCSHYDIEMSSGITYTNSATANVTLMYRCQ